MSDETSEVIVLKERYIPISKDHFLSTLLDKLESDEAKQSFGELASCIEALFYVNRIAKIETFKQCYSCFSRRSEFKHQLSFEELSSRQTKLMHMIYDIINDAHFEAITFEMYKNSIEKVFLSDLPIKVDWAKLDSNLLTQFYQEFPAQNPYKTLQYKPPFHQHFAMFYRGYGLNTMNGLFITPKLNLILADLVPIIQSIISRFIAFATAKLFTKKDEITVDTPSNTDEPLIQKDIEQHLDMLTLQRISLLDTYTAAKHKGFSASIWWFLKNISIQEPTFKRVMLIYRQIPESFVAEQARKLKQKAKSLKKTATKKLGIKKEEEEESKDVVDEIGRKRKAALFKEPDISGLKRNKLDNYLYPIRIQYFSDIPMSDLEITYPGKEFSLKPMDQLYLSFTMFIGVWGILTELLSSTDTMIGYWMVMISIFLMIRSIIWYRATESEYVRIMNQALAESNISSDKDTILSLMDSVDEQQFMETILAYFVIFNNKKEVITDSDGVDRLCEAFVSEVFGEDVNVMIDCAMSKLSELGLFKSSGTSKDDSIKVKELSDALSCVQSHYQSALQTLRKIGNDVSISNKDDDEKKVDLGDDDRVKSDENENTTPPIISAKQISDDHFNDDVQLVD